MTAAEIAARKSMLAELEAARLVMRDTVNAANTSLNAAVLAGDLDLVPVVQKATTVVTALNAYRPELQAAIAATDLLVPSDPPTQPVFTIQPNPTPVVFTQGIAASKTITYKVDKGTVTVIGDVPPGVTRELLPGAVRYTYDGIGPDDSATNELEAV